MSGAGCWGLCNAGCHWGIAGVVPAGWAQEGLVAEGPNKVGAADKVVRGSRFHCMMHIALPQNCSDSYGFCKLALPLPLCRRKVCPAESGWGLKWRCAG
jgi:hypothetical protein